MDVRILSEFKKINYDQVPFYYVVDIYIIKLCCG